MLTILVLLGLLIYILKLLFALTLLSHGVPFLNVLKILNPFAPFTQRRWTPLQNINATVPENIKISHMITDDNGANDISS